MSGGRICDRAAPETTVAEVRITELSEEYEAAYGQFLLHAAHGIYATPDYRGFLARITGGIPRYLIALSGDKVVGAIPRFMQEVDGLGRVYNALPWYGSHGGCLVDNRETNGDEIRYKLLSRFAEDCQGENVLSGTLVTYPHETELTDRYEESLKPTVTDRRIGQVTWLPSEEEKPEECLMQVFGQKTRNLIRKSLRQGFEARCDESDWAWEFLFRMHRENMAAIGGMAKEREHFEALRDCFDTSSRKIWTVTCNGEAAGALLLLYYGITVEYFVPVVRQEYRNRQALSFLIFSAMKDAINKGYRAWNWGGTWPSQKSLHHFKAGFGAVDMPYTYYVITPESARIKLRQQHDEFAGAFRWWYLYPYSEL